MIRRRTPSASSSLFGLLLLVLIVLVTAAGIGSAIYLEQSREPASQAQNTASLSAAERGVPAQVPAEVTPEPPAERESSLPPLPPPLPSPPSATVQLPMIEPAAGPRQESMPTAGASESIAAAPTRPAEPAAPAEPPAAPVPPQQLAALEAPTAAAPAAAAPAVSVENNVQSVRKDGFWIEYGVYAGRPYAERLQRSLDAIGLDAEITMTQTPKGRPLVRVRSAAIGDRSEARAMAKKAERALGIVTLLHTTTIMAPAPAMIGRGGKSDGPYWVQFGSFAHREPAKRLQRTLHQGGVVAIVFKMRAIHHKALFVVRSVKISNQEAAQTLATLGNEVMKIDHWATRAPLDTRHRAAHRHVHAPPHGKGGSS